MGQGELDDRDYERLLAFRAGIRRFLRWSGEQAFQAGLTPTQHLLLLAVRAHDDHRGPTIGEVAECLTLRHHSAVELVDRASGGGLVRRAGDDEDQRRVRLVLTAKGRKILEKISIANLNELDRLRPDLRQVWDLLEDMGAGSA